MSFTDLLRYIWAPNVGLSLSSTSNTPKTSVRNVIITLQGLIQDDICPGTIITPYLGWLCGGGIMEPGKSFYQLRPRYWINSCILPIKGDFSRDNYKRSLNLKQEQRSDISIKIGNEPITQVQSAKLLGMTFESNQKWAEHIYGTGGIVPSLSVLNSYWRSVMVCYLKN